MGLDLCRELRRKNDKENTNLFLGCCIKNLLWMFHRFTYYLFQGSKFEETEGNRGIAIYSLGFVRTLHNNRGDVKKNEVSDRLYNV